MARESLTTSLSNTTSRLRLRRFSIGFGEELWKKFLPKYLEALGATTPIIGLFGTAEDFFDACYQYPGGFVADRFGRRRAFLIFITLASLGYLVYLFSTSWPLLVCRSGIGDGLAKHGVACNFRRYRRLPAPRATSNGFHSAIDLKTCAYSDRADRWRALIASMGLVNGVHVGLLITLALAAVTIVLYSNSELLNPADIRSICGAFGNHFTVY